ncbi:MAG: hypothetical protein ACP5NL_03905 [Thermoplasmata archaeon]
MKRIIVLFIAIFLLVTVFNVEASSFSNADIATPQALQSFTALPEVLDNSIANHTSDQQNNISLNAGGSTYLYGATDGGVRHCGPITLQRFFLHLIIILAQIRLKGIPVIIVQ